ncbi:MAG: NAD(P)H-dependent oxidoreductase [Asticcacaulis sp.]|nr:NAD(P)H-dependent oxidoreductase [Asticcacaulis sp.]
MSKVLIIKSSAAGAGSVSNRLIDQFRNSYAAGHLDATFTENDLGRHPLPPLSALNLAGFAGTAAESPDEVALSETSERLVSEIEAAGLVVIGAPMYNFGVTALLKTWFDYVLRAGRTFRYTETGPVGLLTGKKAIVIESRGGLYSEGPAAVMDSQEPHIRTMLGFVGITDVTFIRAEKLSMGPDARDAAIAAASNDLGKLAAAA